MVKWRPRASSLGYYAACDARALWDRTQWEAGDADEDKDDFRPPADLGTVEHFLLQDGMRCSFPGPPSEFAPSEARQASAAELFGGDETEMLRIARKTVVKASSLMPESTGTWRAETEIKAPFLTGHIDFLSPDSRVLVDLKTTSRPPEGRRVKREHLVQMYAYYLLIRWKYKAPPERGYVLYIDSRGGSWGMLVTVDFTTADAVGYADWLYDYIKYLRSAQLKRGAFPRLSTKCKDLFCPYFHDCHGSIVPPSGPMSEAPEVPRIANAGVRSLKELV